MKPFVKWAGGKRQILSHIKDFIDEFAKGNDDYTYIEPFLGGGAVFFDLVPKKAIINDLNEDLINAYRIIKSNDYVSLIETLQMHAKRYKEDSDGYYYDVRGWDRQPTWPTDHSDVERAARMIFLNRTCYNGLYRVNGKGQFNTPIGRYRNPTICDDKNIQEIHDYLSNETNEISIENGSYENAIRQAKDGDIIYIDPPYDYEDDDGFTKYQMAGFTFDDFKKLKSECDEAIKKGAYVIISNNATPRVIELFESDPRYQTIFYDFDRISTLRSINCKGGERRTGNEAIFVGMDVTLPQANNMDRVIDLLMAEPDALQDKEKAKELINVNTTRQVSYYLSALQYLGYINNKKEFTEEGNKAKKSRENAVYCVLNKLKKMSPFSDVYRDNLKKSAVSKEKILILLRKKNNKLSTSTLERRASTIKSWVEWMYKIDNLGKGNE